MFSSLSLKRSTIGQMGIILKNGRIKKSKKFSDGKLNSEIFRLWRRESYFLSIIILISSLSLKKSCIGQMGIILNNGRIKKSKKLSGSEQ